MKIKSLIRGQEIYPMKEKISNNNPHSDKSIFYNSGFNLRPEIGAIGRSQLKICLNLRK